MSNLESPLLHGSESTSILKSVIAHLPQVHSLTWTDDFFEAIPAAVAVFDLSADATIAAPTLWSASWRLCHLALSMTSIVLVYQRSILQPFACCYSTHLHYEYIPFESIADVICEQGIICLYMKSQHSCSKRRIRGIVDPDAFDHALLALQENLYRSKNSSH